MARAYADSDDGLVEEIGERIGDLRAHLSHAHPLPRTWTDSLQPAELAAIHRRLHGRGVEPDPSLVDTHLVELLTDPDSRVTTAVELEHAVRDENPLVWLPMRIADRAHTSDAPGHADLGGCRACADIIDATIRALLELDLVPSRRIAELERELDTVADLLQETLDRIRPVEAEQY